MAKTLRGHDGPVLSLTFDPEGEFLVRYGVCVRCDVLYWAVISACICSGLLVDLLNVFVVVVVVGAVVC